MASIVLDDTTYRLTTGGVHWGFGYIEGLFGGGDTWANISAPNEYGTLSVSFQGTSLAFSGWVGIPDTPPAFLVSIDGSPFRETAYQAGSTNIHQWYQTPLLSDDSHVVNISHIPINIDLDYMVVTAGPNTPLLGERLIVDDIDPSIAYNGGWNYQEYTYQMFLIDKNATYTIYPHGNGTHRTTTPGSNATFQFRGSSVAVYGIFNWNPPCTMTVKYTIDRVSVNKNYSVIGTEFYQQQVHNVGHTLLFENRSLPAGDHILTMELIKIGPNAELNDFSLALDYILYTPSFESLAELNPSNYSSQGTPNTTITTPPDDAPTIISPIKDSHSKTIAGVAGGLTGGLVILTLLFVIFFRKWYRSRRLKATMPNGSLAVKGHTPAPQTPSPYPGYVSATEHHSVDPFLLLSSPASNISSSGKVQHTPNTSVAPVPLQLPLSTSHGNVLPQRTYLNQDQHRVDYAYNHVLRDHVSDFISRNAVLTPVRPNGGMQSPPPGYGR